MPLGGQMSPAVMDLGLGSMLNDQVKAETDEERKKRMKQQQQMSSLSPASTALGLGAAGYGQ